jgi:indolepyruvate ferredoxin oxidoreductase
MPVDPRFLRESGLDVFAGNELLVKGCLETEGGVQLLTGYPGSPVAQFFDVLGDLRDLLVEKGIRAFQANNEALSVAAVNGSQMAPIRAITAFKSVGVHVASDAMALGNLGGAHPEGGAIIVCGDDPWCDSTQVPADSRFLLEHLRMAVVEPGTSQQMKDWIDLSFKLSRAGGLYVGYIVTTAQADGGGTVVCRPNHFPEINAIQKTTLETNKIDLEKVLLPPRTWQQELKLAERHAITLRAARQLGLNKIHPATRAVQKVSPLGFIVCGMSGPYLRQVLSDIGLDGVFPILEMGLQYPTDVDIVRDFSHHCREMIVIEERRSFLEKNIRDELFKHADRTEATRLSARLFGKQFPPRLLPRGTTAPMPGIPETRGLNPSVLAQILIPLIQSTLDIPADLRNGRLSDELARLRETGRRGLEVIGQEKPDAVLREVVPGASTCEARSDHDPDQPVDENTLARTPTFCPGCPHRDSSAVLLELRKNLADPNYMRRRHKRGPVDLVAHGDTGCYTMLMFQPTEQLMHNYSGMGLGGGTGSGIDPFITNKQIVFMGDGTFFHSGQVAISNAVKANQDITFIILENKTTAMTGHQEHAGTEVDLLGNRSYIQEIYDIVKGMRGTSPMTVRKINPADREKWRRTLETTILRDGVKVLIADKECGITLHRRLARDEAKRAKEVGYLPEKTHMNITPEVCEHCLECTKATACPGLIEVETDYGPKIDTDLTWCVNDGACERVTTSNSAGTNVKPCPSFEQITVIRNKPARARLPKFDANQLPEPVALRTPGSTDPWRVHMTGVGGMGIGVVGAIVVRAGHYNGYRVDFAEKKGLAIRNGGVYAQIAFSAAKITPRESMIARNESSNATSIAPSDASDVISTSHRDASTGTNPTNTTGTTGLIPYGKADLLLGVDLLEAARAIDPHEPFRVASSGRTAAVLNLHKQPTVSMLLGKTDFNPTKLRDRIAARCMPGHVYSRNLSSLCERYFGSKQFANIILLGVAHQLGYIPVTTENLTRAIKDTIRRDAEKNLQAFHVGRQLALDVDVMHGRPEAITWEQLLTQKKRILERTRIWGRNHAERLDILVQSAIRYMPGLSDRTRFDLTLRIYDLYQWGGLMYATRYIDLLRDLYRRDSADEKYRATTSAVFYLAKVMLIKDEPYVAYLLTRYEKKQRDMVKYNVDFDSGDRIVYRHHTSPEFPLGPYRVRLKITTRQWMLKLMSRCRWLRNIPGWHRRERDFREWYVGLLPRLDLNTESGYAQALQILRAPDEVTGYREVRYPKQDQTRREINQILVGRPRLELEIVASPVSPREPNEEERAK